jgi:hypothetical protein
MIKKNIIMEKPMINACHICPNVSVPISTRRPYNKLDNLSIFCLLLVTTAQKAGYPKGIIPFGKAALAIKNTNTDKIKENMDSSI